MRKIASLVLLALALVAVTVPSIGCNGDTKPATGGGSGGTGTGPKK